SDLRAPLGFGSAPASEFFGQEVRNHGQREPDHRLNEASVAIRSDPSAVLREFVEHCSGQERYGHRNVCCPALHEVAPFLSAADLLEASFVRSASMPN